MDIAAGIATTISGLFCVFVVCTDGFTFTRRGNSSKPVLAQVVGLAVGLLNLYASGIFFGIA